MSRSRFSGGKQTGAAAGQGRAQHGRALTRRTLDGTHPSAGHNASGNHRFDFARARAVPLTMVLSHYGILADLKKHGSQLSGVCPLHNGSNPKQFVVQVARNNWHCFSPECNRGGGALDFVVLRENVSIKRAAALMAEWFLLTSPSPRPTRPHQQRRTPMTTRPSHRAYVVEDAAEDQSEKKGVWTKIGSAWPHKDGRGLNIVLSALPMNGRIVLREFTVEDEAADAKRASRSK